jgi:type I restriction enzyme, S subunit
MKLEKIGNVVNVLSGYAFESSFFNEDRQGVPLVRVRDVNSGFAGVYYSGEYDDTFLLENNDLLVGLDGDFKCISWQGGRALLNQRVCKIIPVSNAVNKDYILHFLPRELEKIHKVTNFTTVKHLSVKTILDIKIPIFSFSDQIKIATVLNKAQALIKLRNESIDLLNEILKCTFLKMFGDPVKNDKKFEKGTIRDVVADVRYGTSKPASVDGKYRYLRMNNITMNGYMDYSDLKSIDIDENDKDKYIVKKGDLLFNRTNSKELVGKTGVYYEEDEMVIAGYLIRVRPNRRANSWYLWGYLNSSHGKKTLHGMSKTIVGMANINAQELQNIKILIPPIKLQNQFAKVIRIAEGLRAQFKKSLVDLENFYASLSFQAYKGKLDLSAVAIDKSLLSIVETQDPAMLIKAALTSANRITKQFESFDSGLKVPSGLIKEIEQWTKLEDELKGFQLPDSIIQAKRNVSRIQEAINKSGVNNGHLEVGFNWANLANRINERYKGLHFNFEMLLNFIQKEKVSNAAPYYASEELKANPRLNDTEDIKSFIQSAVRNVEMDEKQQRQVNPFLILTQSFYNAEQENFTLSLHRDDFKLLKNKNKNLRSGIYFSIEQ